MSGCQIAFLIYFFGLGVMAYFITPYALLILLLGWKCDVEKSNKKEK